MAKIKEIEPTPNPDAMRFVLAEPLTNGVTRSYEDAQEAQDDRLAASLFEIEHVINVYYVDRYITVTQDGGAVWSELLRKLAPPIREAEAQENLVDDAEVHVSKEALDSDDPRLQEINRMLDEQVRPYLLADDAAANDNDRCMGWEVAIYHLTDSLTNLEIYISIMSLDVRNATKNWIKHFL